MRYFLSVTLLLFILSCKKENQPNSVHNPYNKIEGDIIWSTGMTHFKNAPPTYQDTSAHFSLDVHNAPGDTVINIFGISADTTLNFVFHNLNLLSPGKYNFQELDSNHNITVLLTTGYNFQDTNKYFIGNSRVNKGTLSIDSISVNHIVGRIDSYCIQQSDSSEVHLMIGFSGYFY